MVKVSHGLDGTEIRWSVFSANWASLYFVLEGIETYPGPFSLKYYLLGWFEEHAETAHEARERIETIVAKSDIHLTQRTFVRDADPRRKDIPPLLRNALVDKMALPDHSIDCVYDNDQDRYRVVRIGSETPIAKVFSFHPVSYPCINGLSYDQTVSEAYGKVVATSQPHYDHVIAAMTTPLQIEADRLLFGGAVPTVWLQEHLWHGVSDLRWYDYAAWLVYMSYFVATYLLAGLLWFFARSRFRRYVATVSLLAAMGFTTYALFPAAPPWLASREGVLDWTTRSIGPISGEIPFVSFSFEGLFERGAEYANPVAAVPSLHAAYTLLITLFLWRSAGRWTRPLLAAYPVAMAFALVYTAEHYLVDILLGWAYAVFALWLVNLIADRRAAKPAAG